MEKRIKMSTEIEKKIRKKIQKGIKDGKYTDGKYLALKLSKLVSLLHYGILTEKERDDIEVVIQIIKDIHHDLYNKPDFLSRNDIHICKFGGCNREFKSHRGLMSHKSRQHHYY